MKRLSTLFAATCLATAGVAAQPYAEVSVSDIMQLPGDSLNVGSLRSPLLGDTVWITGVVAIPPVLDPIDDSRPLLWAGSRWVSFLRDTNSNLKEYAGINILQADTSETTNTLFDRVRPGNVIKALVKISNFPNGPLGGTQVEIIKESQIEFLDDVDAPGDAVSAEVSDFYSGPVGNQTPNFNEGSKYIGMNVELSNVTIVSLTQFDYVLADQSGNEIYMRSQSGYFTKATETGSKPKLRPDFEGYKVGQTFETIRGFITSSNTPGGPQSFMITPVYVEDVQLSDILPPEITSVTRELDKPFPAPTEPTPVYITVQQGSSDIASVKVLYTVDGGSEQEVTATLDGTTYMASIPAQAANALVRFRATATDMNDRTYTYPLNGTMVYRVLDRAATIADVREHLSANGASVYAGYTITLEGVLTTDPTNIAGESFTRMYMQDGTDPYSGLYIVTESPEDFVRDYGRGDKVRLTGTIAERGARSQDNHITALTDITAGSLVSSGNTVEPVVLSTAVFNGKQLGNPDAEQWESMLVEFRDAVVADTNADSGSNFGEFLVADADNTTATMRVETDDSDILLTNRPGTEGTQVAIGQQFPYLRGIMFYSFGNYKLVPRSDDDYQLVTSVSYDPAAGASLRSYPNPFAGETTVEYTLEAFASSVRISLTDMQGRTLYTASESNLAAGRYTFTLNGSSLAAGMYRCTIETAQGTVSTYLVVVR